MEGGVWGLVIIFCAFMIQFLAFGATATIGVYNIELLEYFPGSTVGVSLIASLNYGIFLGSGPIVSFLMTKFSFRGIATFGSALVVLGLLGMPLLPYIPTMCICFGLMTGFGSCCAYIPSHVLSGMYYDKNRSLATGVATSGSGLGGAVMPVVAGLLIETYSWKGSLVVIAGLCLHLFVFSALLHMPKPTAGKEIVIEEAHNASSTPMLPDAENSKSPPEPESKNHNVTKSSDAYKNGIEEESKPLIYEINTSQVSKSKPLPPVGGDNAVKKDESAVIKHVKLGGSGEKSGLFGSETVSLTGLNGKSESFSLEDFSGRSRSHTTVNPQVVQGNRHHHSHLSPTGLNEPHHHLSWGLSHSLSSLHTVGTTRGSYFLVLDDVDNVSSSALQTRASLKETDTKESQANKHMEGEVASIGKKKGPKSSRHIYIFTHYGFNIYFLSNIMWNASCSIVSSFAPEYLRSQGLSSMEAAYLLGAFGFGCFVGGILGGILGNVSWINRQVLYTLANIVMGAVLTAFPSMGHRNLYLLCLLVSGLAFGIILGLLIIVLTDLIGIDSLSNGLGYLMLSNGIGTFIGPPLAGILKETTGGFESGIILAGVLAICGGFIMLLMPCKGFMERIWSSCCCCCHRKR